MTQRITLFSHCRASPVSTKWSLLLFYPHQHQRYHEVEVLSKNVETQIRRFSELTTVGQDRLFMRMKKEKEITASKSKVVLSLILSNIPNIIFTQQVETTQKSQHNGNILILIKSCQTKLCMPMNQARNRLQILWIIRNKIKLQPRLSNLPWLKFMI